MAAPQPIYPSYGQPSQPQSQEAYDSSQHPGFEENPDSTHAQGASTATRKKRHYAGQAYDFGGGANSGLGGQPVGGIPNPGPYPPAPGASNASYGQHPQQGAYHQPGYGDDLATSRTPTYGKPSPGVGGYQPPDQGYPSQVPPPVQPGVGGITQGMNNLGMGGQPQHQPSQMQQHRPQLNQLFPTDLLNQPLNVAELDFPPPAAILPPNVSELIERFQSTY